MEADSHASLRHKYAACALKASFLLLMSMHQSARTEVPQDKMPETPSGEESPVRHLVVKFTPLGGSYSWRISPAQLAMSVATLGKDRVEGSDGDQHVGCGTCALDDYAEAENETQRRPQEGGGGTTTTTTTTGRRRTRRRHWRAHFRGRKRERTYARGGVAETPSRREQRLPRV